MSFMDRRSSTMRLGILCLGILWGTVVLGWAEIYRWKDATGQIHFTDNPEAIPEAYRGQVQAPLPESDSDDPGPALGPPPIPPRSSPPPASEETRLRPGAADSGPVKQKIRILEQQLAAAHQQRQAYIDQINAKRPIRMNPAFGSKRRQVADLGQELAAVERQIDSLQAALQQAQAAAAPASQNPATGASRPDGERQNPTLETASVWQQRFQTARERVRQAQEQRQDVLTRLSGDDQGPREAFGRRGREVIQQTQELQRLEQEIGTAEAALQSLEAAAERAGVPPGWRQ